MEGFWRHSLGVGVSAKLLAKVRGVDTKLTEEYFTAGLLHDIGKIPLNAILSKEYFITISLADKERKSLFEAENNSLGLNHCMIGGLISSAWKLEGAVGDTITHHHNTAEYQGDYRDIVYSISMANQFVTASRIGFSGDCHPGPMPPNVLEALNVNKEAFMEIEDTVNKEIEKAEVFLKINHM